MYSEVGKSKSMAMYEAILNEEYPSLWACTYMDYGGALPISVSQSKAYSKFALQCFSSPHSKGQLSITVNEIEALRSDVCYTFGVTPVEYVVVFLENTTHALNLLSDLLPFDEKWNLFYMIDNHNSVFGLRTRAEAMKAKIINVETFPQLEEEEKNSIFLFPYMSNYSGKHYPLKWCSQFQSKGKSHYVLLDCAAGTAPALDEEKPDFVVGSLLKLTGINGGILMIRRDRIEFLKKPYPAGGSVVYTCPQTGKFQLLPRIEQQIEQGTPSHINLMLSRVGFSIRRKLGGEKVIKEHIDTLSKKLELGLRALCHSNGQKLIQFIPERDDCFSSNFSFNILNAEGKVISHRDINYCFFIFGIIARSGTHCNTSVLAALGWNDDEIEIQGSTKVHHGECLGDSCIIDDRPVGTIRLSLGLASQEKDIDYVLKILHDQFIDGGPSPTIPSELETPLTVKKIFVYPLLGAHGFEVHSWPVTDRGLNYDRYWKLVTQDGSVVNLNQNVNLSSLIASIENDKLVLTFNNDSIKLEINDFNEAMNAPAVVKESGRVYDESVSMWLYEKLGCFYFLVKCGDREKGRFAFSCVSEASMSQFDHPFDINRLRVNILFGSNDGKILRSFAEQGKLKNETKLGEMEVTRLRPRTLCVMTTIVPFTGEIDTKPLQALSVKCGHYGIVQLGSLFSIHCPNGSGTLSVGDQLL